MKKIIIVLIFLVIGSLIGLRAEIVEEKDFAIDMPDGFAFKAQEGDYNSFGTADGLQRIDLNALSELAAGVTPPFLFDTLVKQGFVEDKDLTSRKLGRFCGMGRDGKSFLMVLGDKKGLKICVVIYRWVQSKDKEARENIRNHLINSHSLDRSLHQNSTSSGRYQNIGGGS